MNDNDVRRDPVEELAEEFLARFRRGVRPALTEYTQKYPELAADIRDLFPALVVMEEAGPQDAGPGACGPAAADGRALERLGDYRILREVGRGGMGIVYEAVQEALGRHVALKVLPYQAAADPVRLQRFRREARAAARLHHTNIVPVFDVGEFGGTHYYAMQFIQGQGLDEVVQELHRLRAPQRERRGVSPPAAEKPSLTTSLAGALLNGQFAAPAEADESQPGAADVPAASTPTMPATLAETGDRLAEARRADAAPLSSSEFSTESDFHFYRSVARVGLQAAEALAYAHGQKVLHRDIKPSNLLLDLQGAVWITDFGLAKEEGDDLTKTGDLVGTLRYMAPERFSGVADARGDVYGLGATLYELLTLRPVCTEADRPRLMRELLHQEPPRPRKLDPRVPRDLETIVLKALAKEPGRRYPTEADLAEDLRRFLADRPIRARRASVGERAWRWCRRNPVVASLTGLIAGLVLTVVALAVLDAERLRKEERLTLDQLHKTQEAEGKATRRLYRSLVEQARVSRLSRRVGQRFKTLETLQEAVRLARQLELSEEDFRELRNEAIACLALPDLRVAREWQFAPTDVITMDVDETGTYYARSDARTSVRVCRVADDREVFCPPVP
jgi:serine/threonine protein kinase